MRSWNLIFRSKARKGRARNLDILRAGAGTDTDRADASPSMMIGRPPSRLVSRPPAAIASLTSRFGSSRDVGWRCDAAVIALDFEVSADSSLAPSIRI